MTSPPVGQGHGEVFRDRVEVSRSIASPPAVVWVALTRARDRWWPDLAFEPVVGAPVTESWDEDGVRKTATGHVTKITRESILAFAWSEPGWSSSLAVRFTVVDGDSTTTVTVTETGFDRLQNGAALLAEHQEGWRHHLDNLARAVEG
jgi:uncharacterized protein YndB with AHSA1/START domain